jgi:predicted transcriptional regulator
LLEESEDMNFRTTEKGRSFLLHYQHVARLLAGLNDMKNQHLAAQQDK